MEIVLAEVLGFCSGVRRAIRLAERALADGHAVSTLGSLVHNAQETARLAGAGIHQAEAPEEVAGDTVVIRTHGAQPETIATLRQRRLRLVDATCPFVKKSQQLARQFGVEGLTLVIVGHPDHPEVQGILGYFPGQAFVVHTLADVAALPPAITPGVIAQTTVTEDTFRTLTEAITTRYPHGVIYDTVCSATRERQDAARRLAKTVDIVYVVGGRHSSNTNRLAEICRQACPRTHLIETADEINPADLTPTARVGITAGASTPAWLIDAVIGRLKALGA